MTETGIAFAAGFGMGVLLAVLFFAAALMYMNGER